MQEKPDQWLLGYGLIKPIKRANLCLLFQEFRLFDFAFELTFPILNKTIYWPRYNEMLKLCLCNYGFSPVICLSQDGWTPLEDWLYKLRGRFISISSKFSLLSNRIFPESLRWLLATQQYGRSQWIMGRIAEKNQVNVEQEADNIFTGKKKKCWCFFLFFFFKFRQMFPFLIAALSHLSFLRTHLCSSPDRPPSVAPLNKPDWQH